MTSSKDVRFCWQQITVLLKAVSPNAREPAEFYSPGGVRVRTCAHAYFLQTLVFCKISTRKETVKSSFQSNCLVCRQMTCDLWSITIAFQAGDPCLHTEGKIILDFLSRVFVLVCR